MQQQQWQSLTLFTEIKFYINSILNPLPPKANNTFSQISEYRPPAYR